MKKKENVFLLYFPRVTGRESGARGLPTCSWSKLVVFTQKSAFWHSERVQMESGN